MTLPSPSHLPPPTTFHFVTYLGLTLNCTLKMNLQLTSSKIVFSELIRSHAGLVSLKEIIPKIKKCKKFRLWFAYYLISNCINIESIKLQRNFRTLDPFQSIFTPMHSCVHYMVVLNLISEAQRNNWSFKHSKLQVLDSDELTRGYLFAHSSTTKGVFMSSTCFVSAYLGR